MQHFEHFPKKTKKANIELIRRRTNILQVIDTLDIGGSKVVVTNLSKYLYERGWNVIVCCTTAGGMLCQDLEQAGIKTIVMNKCSRYDPELLFGLMKIMKQYQINIVHTHTFTGTAWGQVAAKLAGVPVILMTEHGATFPPEPPLGAQRTIARIFLSKFIMDLMITVTEELKNLVISWDRINPKKVITVHNGINLKEFQISIGQDAKKEQLGIPQDVPIIGIVANLVPIKDHRNLLIAGEKILKKLPAAQFLIVGDGELREELENLSNEFAISKNVHFLGKRRDISELLSIMDIAVLCSRHEGLSLSLLEYMAMSRPIVATDVGDNRKLLKDGECGLLIPPGDPKVLSQSILTLLEDRDLRKKIGAAARTRVKDFTFDVTASKIEQIYISLIRKKVFGRNRHGL